MRNLATAAVEVECTPADPIREAAARLREALPARTDSAVLVDFLEDDLREGIAAIAEIEAHFTDVLDALRSDRLSAIRLLEAADDFRALQKLEYLTTTVSQLRRRMCQAAGKLHER